ncbi:Leucine-rich_repeat domain superfamily [Hexamita inflata]|uniref:Leucine-rich repeat domain superfamily n=1 Tax=Hexamita inflata TaxID=28002 RepID=A0AA86TI47_9EUKA|nr:Leucine-rich repeat domain superfamily [Hexamita inflata]
MNEKLSDIDMINKYKQQIKNNILKITEPQLSSFKFVDQLNFKKLILNCYDKSQYKTHIEFSLVPLNITKLIIEDCALESISGIRQMTQLIELDLNTNRVDKFFTPTCC